MVHDWFIVRDGKETGPHTAAQLKEMATTGKLKPDDKVRRTDMKVANKASAIKGLFVDKSPAPVPHEPPPASAPTSTRRVALFAAIGGGALLFLCCGGLMVIGVLVPKRPDTTKKEVAEGNASSDKGGNAEADQQRAKPGGQPQVIKLNKGGNREPLELRVLATDEIEVFNNPRDGMASLTGFSLNFDIHWHKPPDKQNPSWPWRYTIYNKKGEKIGEGEVGTRDKSHRPYDVQTQSGQTVMSWIALNRDHFEDAARIDIHR
jgi:hypothetical protein